MSRSFSILILLIAACDRQTGPHFLSPEVAIEPAMVDFGEVFVFHTRTVEIELVNSGLGEASFFIGIDPPPSPDESLPFHLGPHEWVVPRMSSEFIELTFAPDTPGFYESTVILETSDVDIRRMEIPAFGLSVTRTGL